MHRESIVYGNQASWQEHFTASEPLLVTVSRYDKVCTGDVENECAHADGIYRDATPSWYRGNRTVLQDSELGGDKLAKPGGYRSLIIRACSPNCGPAQETGFLFAVCPANDRSTVALLLTNAYSLIGRTRHSEDFSKGKGAITYTVTTDDPQAIAACRAYPDAGFVRLKELPTATN
jgi:hypothetical protein